MCTALNLPVNTRNTWQATFECNSTGECDHAFWTTHLLFYFYLVWNLQLLYNTYLQSDFVFMT